MTHVFQTWLRRYFLLAIALIGISTIVGYRIYHAGQQAGARSATSASSDALAQCQQQREDAAKAIAEWRTASDAALDGLSKCIDGLTDCARTKPCCQVHIVTEP